MSVYKKEEKILFIIIQNKKKIYIYFLPKINNIMFLLFHY
jgi:hypothetical protein